MNWMLMICSLLMTAPVALFAQPGAVHAHDSFSTQDSWQMNTAAGAPYQITVTRVGNAPAHGYPVLYILDGDAYAPLAAAEARIEAEHAIEESYLLVSIGYPATQLFDQHRRQFDDTTRWTDLEAAAREHVDVANTGGAAAFAHFIVQDLRTEIARRYVVDPARQSLFGHSLGGLFVLHVLMEDPGAFAFYAAASPSAWWNHEEIIAQAEVYAREHKQMPRLQISVGEYEQKLSPAEVLRPEAERRQAKLKARHMVDSAARLAALLHAHLVIVPEADHVGSVPEALRLALQVAFMHGADAK